RRARRVPGPLVVVLAQPGLKALASKRPGFSVAVDREIVNGVPAAVWNSSPFASIAVSIAALIRPAFGCLRQYRRIRRARPQPERPPPTPAQSRPPPFPA